MNDTINRNLSAHSGKPIPMQMDCADTYWEKAKQEQFVLPYCTICKSFFFYPRKWCPKCFSLDPGWKEASGKGRVYSFSVVYHAPFESYAAEVPYVLAIIELEEGPRMMTNVVDCNVKDVKIGMPVKVTFEERANGFKLPQFKPA